MSRSELSEVEKSGIEKSGVELPAVEMSRVELSGVEKSGVEKSGVEMSRVELSGLSCLGLSCLGLSCTGLRSPSLSCFGFEFDATGFRSMSRSDYPSYMSYTGTYHSVLIDRTDFRFDAVGTVGIVPGSSSVLSGYVTDVVLLVVVGPLWLLGVLPVVAFFCRPFSYLRSYLC